MRSPEAIETIRAAAGEVLASHEFKRAPALSRMLFFVVENALSDEATLKETVIGHAIFGRSADYDSKIDSVVRVNAKRLRQRLENYYRLHPRSSIRIVLPKGSYFPVFERADEQTKHESLLSKATPAANLAVASLPDRDAAFARQPAVPVRPACRCLHLGLIDGCVAYDQEHGPTAEAP